MPNQAIREARLRKRQERLKQGRQAQRAEQIRKQQARRLRRKQQAKKNTQVTKQKQANRNRQALNVPNVGYNPGEDVVNKFDKTAYIVGGGPSLEHFNWKLLDDGTRFVVGINTAYQVLKNAQVIYFTDDDWYNLHKKQGFLDHPAVKIKGSLNPNRLANDKAIKQMHLQGDRGLDMTPNRLRHGRNSPYAAINMLVQWGFKKIYLMGLDMQHGRKDPKSKSKKKTHWHGGHRRIDNENGYKTFMRNYQELPKLVEPHKVEIINLNFRSKLKCFPTETYEEHFGPDWTLHKVDTHSVE